MNSNAGTGPLSAEEWACLRVFRSLPRKQRTIMIRLAIRLLNHQMTRRTHAESPH